MAPSPNPLSLPPTFSPDALDALSELAVDLAKVRAGIRASTGLATNTGATPTAGGGGSGSPPGAAQHLSFKDVPGATDGIKHKIQRARTQVRELPDMARGIDEQRAEIDRLRARIDAQRELLTRLRINGMELSKQEEVPVEKMEM